VFLPNPRLILISVFSFDQRDHARIQQLSDRLIQSINAQVEQVVRNGDANGYPGCVNLSFSYVEGESLLMALKVCCFILLHGLSIFICILGHRFVVWQCLHFSIP
jgi:hypothetical protein